MRQRRLLLVSKRLVAKVCVFIFFVFFDFVLCSAAALALDVGHSNTFPVFVDQVKATLKGWNKEKFDALVNNAGTKKFYLFIIIIIENKY